ncbi:bifunctional riboflavin kinase/FAD synthetase [Flavobacterium salilacus subsp. salilacus]|uniref:bifunctional riboflavin kinase/FAD synthetase n=1 Tax=Flavobacterium TaxID=237 RepID=UPI0010755E6B|nr:MULTISPECIES: bifunctional riboflavin kinase/FAD synthetase [Flavobacterium]KAF2520206.1 bifunctional riboflavin kinase/FAD synthetase [Flavobacterium salilacus subsp. salilacus]MBE1613876.1 bifunctional riboflavin kinase/FAD synthetase [Flavobacterium sp. SaA2.13]
MKIYNSIQEFGSTTKTIVTLGTFDGVHKGHKSILDRLLKSSQSSDCESVVLTFFPHPRMVLQQNNDIKLLNTMNEKAYLLEQQGIDHLIVHPFDHAFSRLTAEEFVKDILVDKLNICKIIIGHDHRFGRNRTATIDDLIHFGTVYDFEVEQISALEVNEVSVSSTKIRNALDKGDITTANEFLGYNYFLSGTVVEGKKLGRTIGFPTANIHIEEDYKLIPADGVYVVSATIEGKTIQGMMNIGTNPTVGGTKQTIEINFLDFDGNLYGKELRINLHKRLRGEVKFQSIDVLKVQLAEDRTATLNYFTEKGNEKSSL